MAVEIGFTNELTNSQFAPLAVLCAHYQQNNFLAPLVEVTIPMQKRDFSSAEKLTQMMLSILSGCETLSEVNGRLKSEVGLTEVMGWENFADQSSLSCTLDVLTPQNIEQLRRSTTAIWRENSRVTSMIGALACGWTIINLAYPVVHSPKKAKRAISAVKEHHGTPISTNEHH
jgi:hypothetical protein